MTASMSVAPAASCLLALNYGIPMNACCNLLVLHVAYIYRERGGGERGREGESERERERERAAAAAYFSAQLQPSESHNHVVKAIEIIKE